MNFFFTADEHFGHANIIKYCNRPYKNVEEMNKDLIARFNKKVPDSNQSFTVHAGDFCFGKSYAEAYNYIKYLNGHHIFLMGSHDVWLRNDPNRVSTHEIWEKRIDGQLVVVCHYAMRTWAASHYNSWHLYGHSHGKLESIGKSHDIGVDNNEFSPLSWDDLRAIMTNKPDNPNLVVKRT